MRHKTLNLTSQHVRTREDLPPDFPLRLKKFRVGKDWSQKQMAAFLEIAVSHVYNLENGKHTPSDRTVARIGRLCPQIFEHAA